MLKLEVKKPRQFISPLLSKKSVTTSDIEKFNKATQSYLSELEKQRIAKQSEPNIVSNALKPYFENLSYVAQSYSQKGQSGMDLALMLEHSPCVIIEAKVFESPAMITKRDINKTFSSSENEAILHKIESKKNFVFDEKKEIIQGIIGGPDKAFIVSKEELEEFSDEEKLYFKMLHTSTGKFFTHNTKKYICYIAKHNFKDKNIDDYPNIKHMLSAYKTYTDDRGKLKGLAHRREVLKGGIKWFHLWWARDENFFKDGDKIAFASRTQGKNFTYTNKSFYGSRNLFFIKSNRVNLKYITALLNSNLMYFYMHERLKHTGDLLQIDKNQFMKIPLYVPEDIKEFEILVDEIIEVKKQNKDTSELEVQIDQMVYELYGLSVDEVALVEGYNISKRSYEIPETSKEELKR